MTERRDATSALSIVEKHRQHIIASPGVGRAVQDYGIAVCEDILNDLRAAGLGAVTPTSTSEAAQRGQGAVPAPTITPRTDTLAKELLGDSIGYGRLWDHARRLEWELAATHDMVTLTARQRDEAIAARSEIAAIPDGWKLVPTMLTEDMRSSIKASCCMYDLALSDHFDKTAADKQITNLWSDVLSIAPKAPHG